MNLNADYAEGKAVFKRHLFSNGQAVKYETTGLHLKFLLQLPWLQTVKSTSRISSRDPLKDLGQVTAGAREKGTLGMGQQHTWLQKG